MSVWHTSLTAAMTLTLIGHNSDFSVNSSANVTSIATDWCFTVAIENKGDTALV